MGERMENPLSKATPENPKYLGANKKREGKNMKLKDLKIGEYFTLKPLENPKESQVYIRGEYDRTDKKYCCGKFSDISYSRLLDGNKEVYTDFTF